MHRLKCFNTSPQPNYARLLAENPRQKANETTQVCTQKTDLQQLAPMGYFADILLHKKKLHPISPSLQILSVFMAGVVLFLPWFH